MHFATFFMPRTFKVTITEAAEELEKRLKKSVEKKT